MIGTTIERNVTSSRMNASVSTNANTSGRCDFITSLKSFDPAVKPVTATSAPGSLPTVAGTTSSRSTASERSDAASVPVPLTARATVATVLSGLTSISTGSFSWPLASACVWRSSIAPLHLGRRDVVALTTVTAGTPPPGNAASMRS